MVETIRKHSSLTCSVRTKPDTKGHIKPSCSYRGRRLFSTGNPAKASKADCTPAANIIGCAGSTPAVPTDDEQTQHAVYTGYLHDLPTCTQGDSVVTGHLGGTAVITWAVSSDRAGGPFMGLYVGGAGESCPAAGETPATRETAAPLLSCETGELGPNE